MRLAFSFKDEDSMAIDWSAYELGPHWRRKETFEDADLTLAAVRQAFAAVGLELGVATPEDAIGLANHAGLDASKAWFSQNTRRETLRVSEVGGHPLMTIGQVGGMLARLWDQRRFLPGQMLWARTAEELDAEAREYGTPFLAIVNHLADVCDAEELDRRAEGEITLAYSASISGAPDADRRKQEHRDASIRFRTAAAIRRGEIDLAVSAPTVAEAVTHESDGPQTN